MVGVAGMLPLTARISFTALLPLIGDEDVPVPVHRHAAGDTESAAQG